VETVLDARSGQPEATVPLGGKAGNVRYDPADDQVLVDVQTRNEFAVIDPHSRTVVDRVPVPGCDHDHGLLVVDRRAFVACDGNDTLVTLALPGFTQLGRSDLGHDPDVLAADPDRGLLYVAAESGVLTSIDLRPSAGRVIGRAHLADDAHVVAVDLRTGRAYFPVPDAGNGRPGLLITTPTTSGEHRRRARDHGRASRVHLRHRRPAAPGSALHRDRARQHPGRLHPGAGGGGEHRFGGGSRRLRRRMGGGCRRSRAARCRTRWSTSCTSIRP
jgi:hypothetical protein